MSGRRIERIAAQTDFENEESAERFQHDLARLGIEAELRRRGRGRRRHRPDRPGRARVGSPALGGRLSRAAVPVGLLGGTFDPIHDGHLAIAAAVRTALELDEVVFIPAGIPPHKPGQEISPARGPPGDGRAGDRRRAGVPARARSSWTGRDRRTRSIRWPSWLARQTEEQPARSLEFILSAEAFAGFPAWREPGRILGLARLAVVPRAGARPIDADWLDGHLPGWRERVDFIEGPRVSISASTIRDRVRAGRSIEGIGPARGRGLHRRPSPLH